MILLSRGIFFRNHRVNKSSEISKKTHFGFCIAAKFAVPSILNSSLIKKTFLSF